MAMYTVAVDAMGGDHAPDAPIEGAVAAMKEDPSLCVVLTGPEAPLREKLEALEVKASRLEIVDAPEVIGMHDAPVQAVRKKKNSSMVVACELVKQGRAQAAVSAGSTGALMAAGIFVVGRVRGIERPALATALPTVTGRPVVLLDVGANADCQPAHLLGFGLLGEAYSSRVLECKDPKVTLVNIGTEDEKGNMLVKAAHDLMKEAPYPFAGNCEARELLSGDFDVVVADGFTGNIILKTVEGTASAMTSMLKRSLMATPRGKVGAMLSKPALRAFRERMDYAQYGGAPLLGITGIVIKAHGSSDVLAFKNAMHQALHMAAGGLTDAITSGVEKLR